MAIASKVLTGYAHWLRKDPKEKYKSPELEWSFKLQPDEATLTWLKSARTFAKVQFDDKLDAKVINIRKDAKKADGTPASWPIVDDAGSPWDDRLIGNGSLVSVKCLLQERTFEGDTKYKLYPMTVQVHELKEYVKPAEKKDLREMEEWTE